MVQLRLWGLVLAAWIGCVQAAEDCWALTKDCQADPQCSKLLKCATDICAVPVKDRPFKLMNMTCHLMCSCGLDDHLFIPTFVQYTGCLVRTHNITDPLYVGFDDAPYPYQCPTIKESELVGVGLEAYEGTWYMTHGTSAIDNLTCTQMVVTRLNQSHWLGSEYQEAQVGRLGMRWSQVGYLLTSEGPGVFDLRMMLPSLTNMSVCHAKSKIVGYSEDRWIIFEYCSVPYTTEIREPTMGWWSFVLYSRTPDAPQDAVDKFNELLAMHTPTDARTNKTVPIPVKLTTHNQLCRYRESAPANRNETTCAPMDIMSGRRWLRGRAGYDTHAAGYMGSHAYGDYQALFGPTV